MFVGSVRVMRSRLVVAGPAVLCRFIVVKDGKPVVVGDSQVGEEGTGCT